MRLVQPKRQLFGKSCVLGQGWERAKHYGALEVHKKSMHVLNYPLDSSFNYQITIDKKSLVLTPVRAHSSHLISLLSLCPKTHFHASHLFSLFCPLCAATSLSVVKSLLPFVIHWIFFLFFFFLYLLQRALICI